MDRFTEMRVFQAVVEDAGFSAAARRLKMSPPAVTRAIASLEERLGVKLLNRTTRHIRATEAGIRYFEDVRRILEEVDCADEAATGINAEPRGQLSITAPVLFGKLYVMPTVVAYLNAYPEMCIEARLLDRVVNLMEEGLDVGVRIGSLPDSSFRALKVGSVRQVLVAAPSYLEEHGLPKSPDDLKRQTIIASGAGSFSQGWRFKDNKRETSIKLSPKLWVSTNDAAIEATLAGFGICQVISYQVASHLEKGELKILLAEFERPPLPIHILHREGRGGASKIRCFIDMLATDIANNKSLN